MIEDKALPKRPVLNKILLIIDILLEDALPIVFFIAFGDYVLQNITNQAIRGIIIGPTLLASTLIISISAYLTASKFTTDNKKAIKKIITIILGIILLIIGITDWKKSLFLFAIQEIAAASASFGFITAFAAWIFPQYKRLYRPTSYAIGFVFGGLLMIWAIALTACGFYFYVLQSHYPYFTWIPWAIALFPLLRLHYVSWQEYIKKQ